jgi:hypothetical protein
MGERASSPGGGPVRREPRRGVVGSPPSGGGHSGASLNVRETVCALQNGCGGGISHDRWSC